ncbi:MAG: hypothetical protein CSA26_07545 [Desulfobacterales bacterium]|nr:MAG: hypothetical protein CSA26_07545 [Desulfobacterales bacterium]
MDLPSVEGTVFCSLELEIIHSHFKTPQVKSHVTEFLQGMANLFRMSMLLTINCQTIECRFKRSIALSYQLDNRNIMSVFFHTDARKRMIKMMVLHHIPAIQEALTTQNTLSNIYQPGSSSKGSSQKITIKPSLQPRLDIIRNALQAALPDDNGAKSLIIMEKGIQKWATLGPVNKKELPVLADILCKSIADPQKTRQFLRDIEDTFLGIR